MSAPLVSIILACRNPGPRLQAALASISSQGASAAEVIVIDGASTDGTREWLVAHGSRLQAWVSEPDGGVYAAMNKGVRLARGDWLLFLGADDQLAPGALATAAPRLRALPDGIAAGDALYLDGRIYRTVATPAVLRRNFLHHQACFYHRTLFAGPGYDTSFLIQADYEFNLRHWCAGVRPVPLGIRIAECGTGGLSDGGRWANYRDEIRARHRHFPAWRCWLWDAGSFLRYLRKGIVRRLSSHG